jgi:hypothetical protein
VLLRRDSGLDVDQTCVPWANRLARITDRMRTVASPALGASSSASCRKTGEAEQACDGVWRAVVRTSLVVCFAAVVNMGTPIHARAQDTNSATSDGANEDHFSNVWALAGINADIGSRWQTVVRFGYLGGFESRVVLLDVTFAPHEALRLLVGDVFLEPTATGARKMNILRGGFLWRPIRGRFELENRALIEHLSGPARPASPRVRDRLMLTWPTGSPLRFRVFGSIEAFALETSFNAHRYQVGAARSVGRATVELYWTQHRSSERATFNAVGVTAFWRVRPL